MSTKPTKSNKVIAPAVIERTNKTYPNYRDVLCFSSHFDTLEVSFSTYQVYGNVHHLFADDDAKQRRCISMEITYNEAVALRNKLNEFIESYDEYGKYSFMAGVHEDLTKEEDSKNSIDVPLPNVTWFTGWDNEDIPDDTWFTGWDDKDTDDSDEKDNLSKIETDKLVAMVAQECDKLDIPYTYKSPEIEARIKKLIELAKE